MSTEARLKRLGLWHLKDDPIALEKAMDAMLRDFETNEKRFTQEKSSAIERSDKTMVKLNSSDELLLYANRFDQNEWNLFERIFKKLSPHVIHAVFHQGAQIYIECDFGGDSETIENAVNLAGQEALKRMVKWHKKKDTILGISFLLVYVFGGLFFSEAYSQTHGLVSLAIMIIAFGLLFYPWWFPAFKSFIEKYLIGQP